MAELRVNVNVASGYNASLLEMWACRTKRPLSNLAAQLLEEGLNNALRDRRIPAEIMQEVHDELLKPKSCGPESMEDIAPEQIAGDAFRRVLKRKQEEKFDAANKHYEEEAEQMDIETLKEQCDVLPGI